MAQCKNSSAGHRLPGQEKAGGRVVGGGHGVHAVEGGRVWGSSSSRQSVCSRPFSRHQGPLGDSCRITRISGVGGRTRDHRAY
jgi:hypothetical protein